MANHTRKLSYAEIPKKKHPLLKAILNYGGNASAFAKSLGINTNIVYRWIDQDFSAPPAQYCRKIEQLTGGEVTCEQLRPDVFGPSLIVDQTPEAKFKRAIGMMKELEAIYADIVNPKESKSTKKRGK